ncbi:hypothetical protein NA57DRAFT_66526 [Rhizodiscina lignyota]|uniref:Uncharacterized protein n=1 Tax=Rhizodiscina lignyota TaxID=1504668 RepID=A0A9P4IGJ0_9PEZI|nr:hypothetical protein NA57DRAFT_66526 [Rhizodiscina lignyota]
MATTPTATVLLLDLPQAALAGIDLLSFTTTPKFQGVRGLPPGWHFVFTSTNSSLSIRHGVWFRVQGTREGPPEIFVKKWDAAREELDDETDQAEVLRWRGNLGSIWRERLTPYRQTVPQPAGVDDLSKQSPTVAEEHEDLDEGFDWAKLTSHITDLLLSRITGQARDHWSLTTGSSAKRDLDNIPGLSSVEDEIASEKELGFLPIDLKRTWRAEATGRERTEAARDRSWALGDIVERCCSKQYGVMEVLGELQFCFLMILTLNNYSCLEQWKRILQLVFTCTDAVKRWPEFFVAFLATLRLQLQHCQDVEGGLIDLSGEGATLLKSLLRRFKRGLDEISGKEKSEVMDELEDLEDYLRTQHGWQLNDSFVKHGMLELEDGERVEMDFGEDDEDEETGEYAPVIVNMSQVGDVEGSHKVAKGRLSDSASDEEDEQELDDMDARY